MYGQQFYDVIRDGTRASAAVIVPLALSLLGRPHRVIDVGCGEGWWAQCFAEHGCEVIGVDGAHVGTSPLGERFLPHDLRSPLPAHLAARFDLAVCLEVAEHLPANRADSLIADLCALAPLVLFSAAIPGQGGTGHINENWPDYWVTRFATHAYTVSGALRLPLWNDERVECWYRQNLLVAAATPQDHPGVFDTALAPPWPLVHPVLYNARRRP